MLILDKVYAGYGKKQILHGVNLEVHAGEVVSLMGRNGMGKTTTIRTIMGLIPTSGGNIRFKGNDISGALPERISRLGMGFVPEGRGIFHTLSVEEHLVMCARSGHWSLEKIYKMFPRLKERRQNKGHQLSGGEQQMLSIGRALLLNPSLILLDEATEGLAPLVQLEIWKCISDISVSGVAVLVVDKDTVALQKVAQRHYVMNKGEVCWSGSSKDIASDRSELERHIAL
jgi:branched-chain amino acid transport system ATP-binding protein